MADGIPPALGDEETDDSSIPTADDDDLSNRVRRVDPLAREWNLSRVLEACECRREKRLVTMRAACLTQREIAEQLEMSIGWTCETLAAIRGRCGWKNAVPVKKRRQVVVKPRLATGVSGRGKRA